MVAVAQLVEPRVVVPVVEGSSPFSHPQALLGHIDQPTDIFWRSRIYSSAAGGFALIRGSIRC